MSIHDLVPTSIVGLKVSLLSLTLSTTLLLVGSLLSLTFSLALFVLFPSQFLPSVASLHTRLNSKWCPLREHWQTEVRSWNSSPLRTGTDVLVAHGRKASPVRACSWYSYTRSETYFWYLFIPFNYSLFKYSQLSLLLFPIEFPQPMLPFLPARSLRSSSCIYSMKLSPMSTVSISIRVVYLLALHRILLMPAL